MPTLFDYSSIAQNYDSFYDTDKGKIIDKYEKDLMKKMLKQIPPGKSLEIGCGTGHWTEFFASYGNEIIGIDISREMIEVAERKNIPNTVCLVHDVMKMPFRDKFFENIFAITSLEFASDLDIAFKEIKRVLKDYGYLLIGALNGNSEYFNDKKDKEPYKYANFFTYDKLYNYLKEFGQPEIKGSLFFKNNEFIDDQLSETDKKKKIDMATFLIGVVRFTNF